MIPQVSDELFLFDLYIRRYSFYVWQTPTSHEMDETLDHSKNILDDTAAKKEYPKQYSANQRDKETRLLNYFLDPNSSNNGSVDLKMTTDTSSDISDEDEIEVDNYSLDSINEDEDISSTLGEKVINLWNKRRAKLCIMMQQLQDGW